MKEYYARLPFGKEQRLNLGIGNTCPVCKVKRGQEHEYGCIGEECPECHRPIVDCYCECLQPADDMRIVMAIERTFTCIEDSLNAGAGCVNRNADNLSRTDSFNHAPPHLRAKFHEGLEKFFPNIKPCSINDKGERMYSVNDLAEALGLDKAAANEMARTMLGEDENEPAPLAGMH